MLLGHAGAHGPGSSAPVIWRRRMTRAARSAPTTAISSASLARVSPAPTDCESMTVYAPARALRRINGLRGTVALQ
ncbi:hypothetical protein BU52_22555 [Streptomyces toyocaensis]|uniref:Uncharacterized protein n=1 Tax=Streptomyces toyocaensis TaxID=55952 RepID=A0A081XN82_STRTO|nr:hypothetical protein BU52_22555 [Streptomyces toyocaensis]